MTSNALKILYHHRVNSRDGQAVHIEALIGAFRRLGHDVKAVSPPSYDRVQFGDQSRSLGFLKRLLPRIGYEILEIFYNVPVYCRLYSALVALSPDLIYERYNLFLVGGVIAARLHRLPILLEVNSPLTRERARFGGLALYSLAERIERWTWRNADFVLPVSRVLAEMVRHAGVPDERIVVIPNGIDESTLDPVDGDAAKTRLGLSDKTILGFVGFVRDWHGLGRVLDLLAHPSTPADLHFLVIGDGPARDGLELRAKQLGVSQRVTFAGVVDRDQLPGHIAAFDIALQPKAVDYASPLKIFEYMAAGKAIVAPNQPNIVEILTDDRNALLFAADDEDSFRCAIIRLVYDAGLRRRLGKAARQTICEHRYTWAGNAARITVIAQALCRGDRHP
jgi:glycosyltransferase involved in cell wall biosynthesis